MEWKAKAKSNTKGMRWRKCITGKRLRPSSTSCVSAITDGMINIQVSQLFIAFVTVPRSSRNIQVFPKCPFNTLTSHSSASIQVFRLAIQRRPPSSASLLIQGC